MKKLLFLSGMLLALLLAGACSKTSSTNSPDETPTIISVDSSEFNGRLMVFTYDFVTGNLLTNSDVFVYINYNDIARNLWLNTKKTNGNGIADFGYLLQGNYYLVSFNGMKSDTSLVQILGKREIRRNVYLR